MYVPEWLNEFARNLAGEIVFSQSPGYTVQSYRKRYGITQQEMSKILGVRRETISRIENGKMNLTFSFLQNFTKVMAVAEAIKVNRAQQREIDYPLIERISKEIGLPLERLDLILGDVLDYYEKKRRKNLELLEVK